jgi:Tol biopolymer transport system component
MDPDADEIYVMDADGSDQTQLTDNDANDAYPSWSPDGEKIAFTNLRGVYVMNADDGSDVTRLTFPPNAHYATIDWGTNTSTPDDKDDKDKKHDQ